MNTRRSSREKRTVAKASKKHSVRRSRVSSGPSIGSPIPSPPSLSARSGKKPAPGGGDRSAALRHAAGEVLVAGLEGPSLSAVEKAWLRLIRPGGIILFRRNIEEAGQTHALLASAKEALGESSGPLLRAIDVEGGTVDRLRDLIAPMPAPFAVSATGKPSLFAAHGRLIARELRLLGLNVTLAPVLDLRTPVSESVLTTRAAAADPDTVAAYARGFLLGLAQENVLGCGKHFPGLGSGEVDSHHLTPEIRLSLELLWNNDLLPYRTLARELPLVMVSHARYPLTASGSEPASISRFWINEVLRGKIGFRGLVISDDMEMGGILSHTSLAEAAIQALLAGTELIEICHDPARIFTAFEALLSEAERSSSFAQKLLQAARQVRTFKQRYLGKDRLPKPPSGQSLKRMRAAVLRFAGQVSKRQTPVVPSPKGLLST